MNKLIKIVKQESKRIAYNYIIYFWTLGEIFASNPHEVLLSNIHQSQKQRETGQIA